MRYGIILSLLLISGVWAQEFPGLPNKAFCTKNCVNVKMPPFNARGDGKTDDTKAIQQALYQVEKGIIYFPPGTYLVSDTLVWKGQDKKRSWPYRSLIGAGEKKTIIRLKDNAPGFNKPGKGKPVIATGGQGIGGQSKGSQAFCNSLYYLTVDVGNGNPGANGMYWMVSNEGTLRKVTFKAGPDSGNIGIAYNGESCGLAVDVTVDGFAYGIKGLHAYQNFVGENITLKNQRKAGVEVHHGVFDFNNLTSINKVPAVIGSTGLSRFSIQNSKFTGGSPQEAAVKLTSSKTDGTVFLRDIKCSGYGKVVSSAKDPAKDVAGGTNVDLKKWSSHKLASAFPGNTDWKLTPKCAPEYWTADFKKWANVRDYIEDPAAPDYSGAIQEAIDSGAEIVYLPSGNYTLLRPIKLRGKVRRLIGLRSVIKKDGFKNRPWITVKDIEGPDVTIEMFCGGPGWIRVDTPKTVVVRDCFTSVTNTKKAKEIFLEGVSGSVELTDGVKGYIRQLDPEGKSPNGNRLLVDNSTAWILSMKTEGPHQLGTIKNNAVAEILSLTCWPMKNPKNTLGFEVTDSKLRVLHNTRPDKRVIYKNWVKETQNGKTKTVDFKQAGPMYETAVAK